MMPTWKKVVLWFAFIPAGVLGAFLAWGIIFLMLAAPYFLFGKLDILAVLGSIPAWLAFMWVFLHLSWFVAPLKSRVEAWVILIIGSLITLSAILHGLTVIEDVGAPLVASLLGIIYLVVFARSSCFGARSLRQRSALGE